VSEQIYSLPPLTTRTPILKRITDYATLFQEKCNSRPQTAFNLSCLVTSAALEVFSIKNQANF
ncbi:MAG: hypothetical protein ABJA84_11290, partial [Polaromonas sp.]